MNDSRPIAQRCSCSMTTMYGFSCNNLSYMTSSLANASVVITFHDNEILPDVLHTVSSVLLRTPPRLLTEIILVDDGCEKGAFTHATS